MPQYTGLKDKGGKMIFVGDEVWFEGHLYEVIVNEFGDYFAIDNDLGQGELNAHHHLCTKA